MLIVGATAVALILVIWFGYPLLIRMLGSLRSPPPQDPPSTATTVSVVLASRDDADAIRGRVADLLDGQYPADRLEIVVALDPTRSWTGLLAPESLGPAGMVRVVAGDEPGGKSATLNAAVRAATNDVLVFTDTAQRFDDGAIVALVSALGGPRVGAVSGMLDIPERAAGGAPSLADRYWWYERWLRSWEARVHSCVGVTGAIYAMPRRLWQPLPANLILDDVYVPMRLGLEGWRVGFTDRARARDVRRFAPAQEYRRKVRTLTGVIQVCAWLPGVLNPIRNPIWLQFVFHKLLRLLTPYLVVLAVIGIAWSGIRMLLSRPGGLQGVLVAAALAASLCLVPRVRRVLKGQLTWGLALQGSIIVATLNGVRGKWDVWR